MSAAEGRLEAHGRITIVNTAGTPREATVRRVEEGTANEDLHAYFDALRQGQQPPWSPSWGARSVWRRWAPRRPRTRG